MTYEDFIAEEYIEKQLVKVVDWSVEHIFNNDECVGLLIDGTPGTGKTTNACVLAKYLQSSFDVEKQVGRGIDQFVKAYNHTVDKVKACSFVSSDGKIKSKIKVCVYDEANDSDRAGSRGKIQRILLNLLTGTSRQDGVVLIVVLHRFYRLDERFFDNGLIDVLINFDYKVNKQYSHFRCYDLDCLLWMSSLIKRGKVVKKPSVYTASSPNFYGKFKFAPVDFAKTVESLSKVGKDQLRNKGTKEIFSQSYYTVPVVASMLGKTKSAVDYQINKLGLKKLYLREKAGKVFFYDKDLFAVLKKVFDKEVEVLEGLKA